MTNKAHLKELDNINKDLNTVRKQLIKVLQTAPTVEVIDLYYYINLIDTLKLRKSKIQTLIALEYK